MLLPAAEFTLGHALVTVASIFLFVVWFWIVISIVSDLISDPETSGVSKAGWVFFLIFLPFVGMLAYLAVRGEGMSQRAAESRAQAQQQFDAYVRQAAGSASPADELERLSGLRSKGDLTDAEFEAAKAKLLT